MKYFTLAILTASLLSACQGDNSTQADANKPRAIHHAPVPKDNPTVGMNAEQLAKYQVSIEHFKDINLGQPTEMMAQTAHHIAGTEDTIEFSQIGKDTRCPSDAKCTWMGEVTVILKGTHAGKTEQFLLGNKTAQWHGYQLTIREVLPHPAQKVAATLPTLVLQVDKMGTAVVAQDIPGTIPPPLPAINPPLGGDEIQPDNGQVSTR